MTSDSADRSWLDSVTFEAMTQFDLAGVLRIERISFPTAWTPESYLREIHNVNSYYMVARYQGTVVGYAGMWVIQDEAHVSTIAVAPEYRRRGLGEALMRHLMVTARSRHAILMTLEVREHNLIAQTLYRKLGFQTHSFLPHYYGDTGENAYVMRRELGEG